MVVNNLREIGPTISNCDGSVTIKFKPVILRYAIKNEPLIPVVMEVSTSPYTDIIRTIPKHIKIPKIIPSFLLLLGTLKLPFFLHKGNYISLDFFV